MLYSLVIFESILGIHNNVLPAVIIIKYLFYNNYTFTSLKIYNGTPTVPYGRLIKEFQGQRYCAQLTRRRNPINESNCPISNHLSV